jgi:DNA-binding NarL/FixJ family response regulator
MEPPKLRPMVERIYQLYARGMDIADIAKATRLSNGAVRNHMLRARKAFKVKHNAPIAVMVAQKEAGA